MCGSLIAGRLEPSTVTGVCIASSAGGSVLFPRVGVITKERDGARVFRGIFGGEGCAHYHVLAGSLQYRSMLAPIHHRTVSKDLKSVEVSFLLEVKRAASREVLSQGEGVGVEFPLS